MYLPKLDGPAVIYVLSEKAAPLDQDTNTGTQPLPIPNTSYSQVVCSSPAASLGNSPCQSPMLREEDELSETGESEGEDEDEGPGPHGMESDIEVTVLIKFAVIRLLKSEVILPLCYCISNTLPI